MKICRDIEGFTSLQVDERVVVVSKNFTTNLRKSARGAPAHAVRARTTDIIYNGRNLSFVRKVLFSEFFNEPRRGELKNELKKAFSNETIIKAPFKIYPTFIPLESRSDYIYFNKNEGVFDAIIFEIEINNYKHGDCLIE